jgi:multiple sugar transport system permease protein
MRRKQNILLYVLLVLLVIIILSPIYFLFDGSFMSNAEISDNLSAVLKDEDGFAKWTLYPTDPSLQSYIKLLLYSPEFYVMFWNSIKLVFLILLGQLVLAVPAAWGFARLKIPFKNTLFNIYIILMLMPFQVTMLSNYLTLDKLHLINTHASIILPAVFSTFPVFIMYRFFSQIPDSIIEAAQIDGANRFQIFVKIGLPLGHSGIAAAMILGFLEYWNLIEQPLAFLTDKALWPLSLYLPNIGIEQAGIVFTSSIILLIPSFLVFLAGQDYLEQGILAMGSKE